MTVDGPPLPTFLIIGAQKSATRWLRSNLGQHPEVFTVDHEVKYFNHPRRIEALGTDWYRAQFCGWAGEPVIGEATPGYLMLRHQPEAVAQRIDDALPDVRLLALLRNPVDRARSALVHHQRSERIPPGVGLVQQLQQVDPEDDWMGLVSGGRYAESLEPYLDRFGDRLLVLIHDDLRRAATETYQRAVTHIGAANDFEPPSLAQVYATNRSDDTPLAAEQRREAYDYFAEDVARLEDLLDRSLSCWKP